MLNMFFFVPVQIAETYFQEEDCILLFIRIAVGH